MNVNTEFDRYTVLLHAFDTFEGADCISDRELFEKYKDQTFTDKDFIVSR